MENTLVKCYIDNSVRLWSYIRNINSATLNGGIFLAATAVDQALKGSMTGERMNKSFGREVRGRG
jgi:hypothetical protein